MRKHFLPLQTLLLLFCPTKASEPISTEAALFNVDEIKNSFLKKNSNYYGSFFPDQLTEHFLIYIESQQNLAQKFPEDIFNNKENQIEWVDEYKPESLWTDFFITANKVITSLETEHGITFGDWKLNNKNPLKFFLELNKELFIICASAQLFWIDDPRGRNTPCKKNIIIKTVSNIAQFQTQDPIINKESNQQKIQKKLDWFETNKCHQQIARILKKFALYNKFKKLLLKSIQNLNKALNKQNQINITQNMSSSEQFKIIFLNYILSLDNYEEKLVDQKNTLVNTILKNNFTEQLLLHYTTIQYSSGLFFFPKINNKKQGLTNINNLTEKPSLFSLLKERQDRKIQLKKALITHQHNNQDQISVIENKLLRLQQKYSILMEQTYSTLDLANQTSQYYPKSTDDHRSKKEEELIADIKRKKNTFKACTAFYYQRYWIATKYDQKKHREEKNHTEEIKQKKLIYWTFLAKRIQDKVTPDSLPSLPRHSKQNKEQIDETINYTAEISNIIVNDYIKKYKQAETIFNLIPNTIKNAIKKEESKNELKTKVKATLFLIKIITLATTGCINYYYQSNLITTKQLSFLIVFISILLAIGKATEVTIDLTKEYN